MEFSFHEITTLQKGLFSWNVAKHDTHRELTVRWNAPVPSELTKETFKFEYWGLFDKGQETLAPGENLTITLNAIETPIHGSIFIENSEGRKTHATKDIYNLQAERTPASIDAGSWLTIQPDRTIQELWCLNALDGSLVLYLHDDLYCAENRDGLKDIIVTFILPEVMKLLARWHHGTKWDEIDLDSDLRDEIEIYLKELCPSKDNDVEQYVTDVAEAFNSRERVLITAKTIAEQISLS